MAQSDRLPNEIVDLLAERFRAIGEPIRIRILEELRESPRSVQELVEVVGSSQQNVSKHLGVLRGLGIVSRRRSGSYAVYTIQDESLLKVCDEVCGALRKQISNLNDILEREVPA